MSLAICGATRYRHTNVAQLWSSLSKTRGVASLWRYGVCLSRAEGHPGVTDPRFPPHPVPPQQKNPKKPGFSKNRAFATLMVELVILTGDLVISVDTQILPMPELPTSFCVPFFPMPPLGGDHGLSFLFATDLQYF